MGGKSKDVKFIKSRAFRIELYSETESYDSYKVLKHIVKNYDCVFIYHNKDMFDDGTPKKPHYHFVIRWSGAPRYSSGLAKELGIDERFILPCYGDDNTRTCLKYSLTYLVHKDELEKYQYSTKEVRFYKKDSKLYQLFKRFTFSDVQLSEGEILLEIDNFIKSQRYVSTSNLLFFTVSNGWHGVYKKYSSTVHRLLDEHNYHYSYKDYD